MYGQNMLRSTTPRNYSRDNMDRSNHILQNNHTSSLKSNLPTFSARKPLFTNSKGGSRGGFKNSKIPPARVIHKNEKESLLQKLSPMQRKVTQDKVTERPYSNQFYKHFEPGTYSCVVCGEDIFRSTTKYDSQSGWPAFYDIIDENKVTYKEDLSHLGANLLLLVCNPSLARIEVSCSTCNAHLGHAFEDGPKPTGKRYCVNSTSLTFSHFASDAGGVKTSDALKRSTKDEFDGFGDCKKRFNDCTDGPTESISHQNEPIVHVASSGNSCAMGSRICFRVPNAMESFSPPMS